MILIKRKGYRVESKVRSLFEGGGWKVVRAGASLGEADLICMKEGRCLLLQVKSTRRRKFYYYEYMGRTLQGFPFLLVVDFGYNKIRVMPPQKISSENDGEDIRSFILAARK